MQIQLPNHRFFLRTTGVALLGGALVLLPWLVATPVEVTMSIDHTAPVQVTLLPTVTVSASTAEPERVSFDVEDRQPLAVTLLPTVHVHASVPAEVRHTVADTKTATCANCPRLFAGQ